MKVWREACTVAATVMIWICYGHKILFHIKVFFYLFLVFTLFPSENKVWNLLTRWLSSRALILLQTHVWLVLLCCLCTLKPCQSAAALRCDVLRCAVLFCAVLCCDAVLLARCQVIFITGKTVSFQSQPSQEHMNTLYTHTKENR